MKKDIDIKARVVHMYNVDTGQHENEIIGYLEKQMKVRFHSVVFNNANYTFISKPSEQVANSLTISGFIPKKGSRAVIIEK